VHKEIRAGIDLGTTNSVIACGTGSGRPQVIANAEGGRTTPSVVQVRPDGTLVVGDTAKREAPLEVQNTARFFKRDMGTDARYEYWGATYTPVDLSAAVLRKLKQDAELALSVEISEAVVTVPAYFRNAQRLATQEACSKAGLTLLQTINEPTAAALAFGSRSRTDSEVVLVYDLGGGTFDVTLVRVAPDAVEVIGTDGNHQLGGKDWDDRLMLHVNATFRDRHGVDPLDEGCNYETLLMQVEEAKKALSAMERSAVILSFGGISDGIEVSRSDFELLTRDLLAQTEILVRRVLEEARMDVRSVARTLLVGAATRMPMCRSLLRDLMGKEPDTSLNPDECVAIGAAIQARACVARGPKVSIAAAPASAKCPSGLLEVRDVMSHSLGMIAISQDGGRYINDILLPRNRPIPCVATREYGVTTRVGGRIAVYVTQGEEEDPASCTFVGKYVVLCSSRDNANKSFVDISYSYDRSGVVGVSAVLRSTGEVLVVEKEALPEDMTWVTRPPVAGQSLRQRHVCIAIDLSGSMRGKPLADAQKAVRSFLHNIDLARTSVSLISFADKTRIDARPGRSLERLETAVGAWGIGQVGIGNETDPFGEARNLLSSEDGDRLLVVLTDGVWDNQTKAIEKAKQCSSCSTEIIAIGFGAADSEFLRSIATSDESALYTDAQGLSGVFEEIAQVLLREPPSGGIGQLLARRKGA